MERRAHKQTEFLQMLDQCKGIIVKVCLIFGPKRDRDSLRDAFQDIVCTLWESWPTYRGESSVETWVYRVALNTACAEHRRTKRMPQFVEMDENFYDSIADEAGDDRYQRLYDLIDRLSDDGDRQMVMMYIDRRPTEEIAQLTGLTPVNVRQRLTRIRKKLINLKERYYGDD